MIQTKVWNGMSLVKISTVPNLEEFKKWMRGQTCPVVEDDPDPFDWCYAWDYERFIKKLPIID